MARYPRYENEDGDFSPDAEMYVSDQETYSEGDDTQLYNGYGWEDAEPEEIQEAFDDDNDGYAVYDEESEGKHRFHMAMHVFNGASVLVGIVVVLALTALVITMISWLREDILHSFILLQSGLQ